MSKTGTKKPQMELDTSSQPRQIIEQFRQQAEPLPTKPKERRQHRYPKGIYLVSRFCDVIEP